jgi:hypothetical protein
VRDRCRPRGGSHPFSHATPRAPLLPGPGLFQRQATETRLKADAAAKESQRLTERVRELEAQVLALRKEGREAT